MEKIVLFTDSSAVITGKASKLNNKRVVPVILAKEMIQYYHRSELPTWLTDQLPKHMLVIPVLKKYEALVDSIVGLQKLPITFHLHQSVSSENDTIVEGFVQELKADDKRRLIKGRAYVSIENLTDAELEMLDNGTVIDVSVGGSCSYGIGGYFKDELYIVSQDTITLNHLVILFHDAGRCPAGTCGLNMDKAYKMDDSLQMSVFYDADAYSGHIVGFCDKCTQEPIKIDLTALYGSRHISDETDIEDNTKVDSEMTDEDKVVIAELKKKLENLKDAKTDKQVESLKKGLETVNDEKEKALSDLKDKNVELETINKLYGEAKEVLDKIAKAKLEDMKKIIIASEKYSIEDLKGKEESELNIIFETLKKSGILTDAQIKKGFPKPDLKDRKDKLDGDKDEFKDVSATIDMNELNKPSDK